MNAELRHEPVTILLAEDSETDVDIFREVMDLSKIYIDLHVVVDGVACLEFLRCQGEHAAAPRPDIVLLDLNMPRLNGEEVLRQVKEDPELKRIPVVVLTSSQAEEDIVKSYDLHANCFVTVRRQNEWDGGELFLTEALAHQG